MSEFKSVDAWAVVREDGSPHLIDKLGCSPKFMEVVPCSDPNAWAMHEFYAKKDDGRRVVPVTIARRAAWLKVTPDMDFEKGLYWVKPSSSHIGVQLAEWCPRDRSFELDLWTLWLRDVSHIMPAHVPQAPEGE